MKPLMVEQGSPEWHAARVGSLGASQIKDAFARTKSGWGASRKNLIAQIVAERLTGEPSECFCSADMMRGTELEPEARRAYEFMTGNGVEEVGLYGHPTIEGTHASPDGLVGEEGLLEIKCPRTANHIDYILGGKPPAQYVPQMLWQMACAGRKWCDFVSYDPRMPIEHQLFIVRLERDDEAIKQMEADCADFMREVEEIITKLNERNMAKAG